MSQSRRIARAVTRQHESLDALEAAKSLPRVRTVTLALAGNTQRRRIKGAKAVAKAVVKTLIGATLRG